MKSKISLFILIVLYGCSSFKIESNMATKKIDILIKKRYWVEPCKIDSNVVNLVNRNSHEVKLTNSEGVQVVKYVNNIKHGWARETYFNGLTAIGRYIRGEKSGEWSFFDKSGFLIIAVYYYGIDNPYITSCRLYSNGKLIYTHSASPGF